VKTKLSCNLLQKLQLQLLQTKLSCKNVQYFFVLLDFFAVRRLCRDVFCCETSLLRDDVSFFAVRRLIGLIVRLLCCEIPCHGIQLDF
jgi:hypothetical protein